MEKWEADMRKALRREGESDEWIERMITKERAQRDAIQKHFESKKKR